MPWLPQVIVMQSEVLETYIEKKSVEYAQRLGFEVFKMGGRKGISDRLFMRNGIWFFIEFKRPKGGKEEKLQEVFARQMKAHGVKAYRKIKTQEQARLIIDKHYAESERVKPV